MASRQALVSWLSRHIVKPKNPKGTPKPSADTLPKAEETASNEASPSPVSMSLSDILCCHGELDPEKVQDMKVVKAVRSIALPRNPSVIPDFARPGCPFAHG